MPFLYSSKNKSNHQNLVLNGFKSIPNFSRDSSYTNEFPPTIMCQSCHQTFNSHQDYSAHELSCCGILPPPPPRLPRTDHHIQEGSKSPTNSSFSSSDSEITQSPPPHLHTHTHTHNHTLFSSHQYQPQPQLTTNGLGLNHHHQPSHMQSLSFLEDTPPITSNINSFDLFNSNDDELPAPMEEEQQNVDNKFNTLFKSDNTTPEQLSIPVSELVMSTPVLESEQMLSSSSSLLPPMSSKEDYFNTINTNPHLRNTYPISTSNPFNMSSMPSPDPMSFLKSSSSNVPSFNGQPFLSDTDSQALLGLDIPVLDRKIDDTIMKEEQDDDLPPPLDPPPPPSSSSPSSLMHSKNDFPEIFPLKPEQKQKQQAPSSRMKNEEQHNYKLPEMNMDRSSSSSTSSSKEMFLPKIPSSARSSSLVYEKYDAETDQKIFIDPLDGSEFHEYEFLSKEEENFDNTNLFVQCSKCFQSFYGKRELYDHIKSTHWFHCDECSAIFAVYGKLVEHKNKKHSLEKIRDFCKHCGKGFDNPKYLKKHEMRHEKCFTCDTCPKSFGSRESLKIHKRTHDGDKPLKCKVCNRGFADPSALRRHLNTHSGLKPFICEWSGCGHRFARKDTLQKHMVTHTGEKAFTCEVCGRKFGHKSSLQRHKKKLHSK